MLSLPNLFPSLARHFACCQSCSVSLRTLWAWGFNSAAPRAPEKSKVGEKEKYFIPFNQLYFLKSRLRSAIKTKPVTLSIFLLFYFFRFLHNE